MGVSQSGGPPCWNSKGHQKENQRRFWGSPLKQRPRHVESNLCWATSLRNLFNQNPPPPPPQLVGADRLDTSASAWARFRGRKRQVGDAGLRICEGDSKVRAGDLGGFVFFGATPPPPAKTKRGFGFFGGSQPSPLLFSF